MDTAIDPGKTPRQRGDSDAPHVSPVTPAEDARSVMLNKISWGAVFAGVVVALVVQLIANLVGVGIGAASLDPGPGATPGVATFSIGAGLWFVLSGILGALAGGYAAGRLSGKPKESTASWHGLTSWALTTLIVIWLVGSGIGTVVGGAYGTLTSALGSVAGAAGSTVQAAAGAVSPADLPMNRIEQQVRSVVPDDADPAALREAAVSSVRALLIGSEAQKEAARERAIEAVARAQGITPDAARVQVEEFEAEYQQAIDQAQQTATEVADIAASAVSTSALLGAVALILGAVAGWFGGRMGAVDPTVTARART